MEVNHRFLRIALESAALIFPDGSKWEMEVEQYLPRFDFMEIFGGLSYTLIAPTPERVMKYAQILREHSPNQRYPITNGLLRLKTRKKELNHQHVVWGDGSGGMIPDIMLYDWLVEHGQDPRRLVPDGYRP